MSSPFLNGRSSRQRRFFGKRLLPGVGAPPAGVGVRTAMRRPFFLRRFPSGCFGPAAKRTGAQPRRRRFLAHRRGIRQMPARPMEVDRRSEIGLQVGGCPDRRRLRTHCTAFSQALEDVLCSDAAKPPPPASQLVEADRRGSVVSSESDRLAGVGGWQNEKVGLRTRTMTTPRGELGHPHSPARVVSGERARSRIDG